MSSCIPQTFLSLPIRVVVFVPFGVSFAQLRLICCLCVIGARVVVPERQPHKCMSLTRPLVML